jgi:hypothetical protein
MRGTQNWRMCPAPDSPQKSVKSTAVVKYTSVQSYAKFALLQCNTNLNLPPSNWLSSSAESYGLQYVPSHSSGFSRYVSPLKVESVAFSVILLYPHNKIAEFDWRLQHREPMLITAVRRLKVEFQNVKHPCFLRMLIAFGLKADFQEAWSRCRKSY